MDIWNKILSTDFSKTTILIRLMVGAIFLSEGFQKFLFPESVGAGRFEKIGFDNPHFWAQFTGTFEIGCGVLILVGLLTRIAVIPLVIVMLTALVTTKWPIFIEQGFWKMAHETRTDFAMVLSLIFLLMNGAGHWSVDAMIKKRKVG
jgi:putative oxidoreductase